MEPHSEIVNNHLNGHNESVAGEGDKSVEKNGNVALLPSRDKDNNALDCELSWFDESVDEQNNAPMEILAEFLSALMSREYKAALNYCQQILQYEPNNKTALEFYPLIQQKIEMEESKIAEYSSEEESGETTSLGKSENKGSESSEYYSSAESGSENPSTHSVSSSEDEDSSCPATSE